MFCALEEHPVRPKGITPEELRLAGWEENNHG